ncbi:hypothetical protein BDA96_06G302000 [Sorghum bicolor]|nr:peroxidase 10 [Sorghum bicolor]KAG0528248.1 hypothetical protein BDA96_06G302000 [Sorghum bicolor]OQU82628.1 hypothetical protein SORBI_3006G277550 [Sorghum bicolor]|eukprot:XP_002448822.2 peroxidase 10 [Sorghum bicolor]
MGIAAGLIRIFFHDCFPQGCDASVLLSGSDSEQNLGPNETLRPEARKLIDDIRAAVHAACGPTVSCMRRHHHASHQGRRRRVWNAAQVLDVRTPDALDNKYVLLGPDREAGAVQVGPGPHERRQHVNNRTATRYALNQAAFFASAGHSDEGLAADA